MCACVGSCTEQLVFMASEIDLLVAIWTCVAFYLVRTKIIILNQRDLRDQRRTVGVSSMFCFYILLLCACTKVYDDDVCDCCYYFVDVAIFYSITFAVAGCFLSLSIFALWLVRVVQLNNSYIE